VTVNVVAPGFIDTDMTRGLPDSKNAMLGQIALGRLGEPLDIARAVAFLASPAAAYITGETLHVNGGMYMPEPRRGGIAKLVESSGRMPRFPPRWRN
jgi:3-oxoacyl-[acyl-carrier protein] reductase